MELHYIFTRDIELIKFIKSNPIGLIAFNRVTKNDSFRTYLDINIEELMIRNCPNIKVYFEEESRIKRKDSQNHIDKLNKVKILKGKLEKELQNLV